MRSIIGWYWSNKIHFFSDLKSAIGATDVGVAESTAATNQDTSAAAEPADHCTAMYERRKAK